MRLASPLWLSVALALLGGSLLGCGSASKGTPSTSTASSTPVRVTAAQAAAFARAVNLQAGDVPSMSAISPESEFPPVSALQREEGRCAGNVDPRLILLRSNSAKFAGVADPKHEQIYSNVEVFPTAALAEKNNAANKSQRFIKCAEHFLPMKLAEMNGARVHYGRPEITRLPNPLPGAVGLRVTVPILGVPTTIEPTQPHVYIDILGFVSGPAEVALAAVGFPQPVPEEVEQRLLSRLYSRAQTYKL